MEARQIIGCFKHTGEDFKAVLQFDDWKLGIIKSSERFSSFKMLERHLLTDEAFVLLYGEAILYVEASSGEILSLEMERECVYNVPRSVWHHIVVSNDATVLVVENSNTSKENTEKKIYTERIS